MDPTSVLARECLDALALLGPSSFEQLAAVVRSRPVLARDALARLVDARLVDLDPESGLYDLLAHLPGGVA